MRILAWIIGIPLAAVAITFAIANRGLMKLDLWPLPFGVEIPVYVTVLGALVAGFVLGAIAMWLAGGRLRSRVRQRAREVRALERETEDLRTRLPTGDTTQAAA